MPRYWLSARAEADLLEIVTYVAADRPRAAEGLLRRIQRALELLGEQPGMGREASWLLDGARARSVPPYVIVYRVREGGVEVLAIAHSARDLARLFGVDE